MNKNLTALISAASLGLLGCGTKYPQYSGEYELQNSSYTNPAFAGKKRIAWKLAITHRMKYVPNIWNDQLRLEFTSDNPENEITGRVMFDLEDLTRDKESTFPQPEFKGQQIHAEKTYYGGVFCNYQYLYHAFAVLTPGEQELKKVYPEKGKYLYTEPSGMPIYESFNANNFEPDQDAIDGWYDVIEENGGMISLNLFINRDILSDTSGCGSNSYLPYDPRGKESLEATYYSVKLENDEDPRQGYESLPDNTIPPIDLFKEVISEVKDL